MDYVLLLFDCGFTFLATLSMDKEECERGPTAFTSGTEFTGKKTVIPICERLFQLPPRLDELIHTRRNCTIEFSLVKFRVWN